MQWLGCVQFILVVSFYVFNQCLCEEFIFIVYVYFYDVLFEDCCYYLDVIGWWVSFEYIFFGEFNDQFEYVVELVDCVGGFQSYVNLIVYNLIEEEEFK